MTDSKGAVLSRVTQDGLAYLVDEMSQKVFPFTFDKITDYKGETVAELGLKPGSPVTYNVDSEGRVVEVALLQKIKRKRWAFAR